MCADDGRMTSPPLCAPSTVTALDIVVRELGLLGDRLLDAAARARGIAVGTDWHSEAARAFHEKADRWAGDVSALTCLLESARIATVRARAVAQARHEWGCP